MKLLRILLCTVVGCAQVAYSNSSTDIDLSQLEDDLKIVIIPPTITLPKDAKLTLKLPVFGTVDLRAVPGKKEGEYNFIADAPPAEKPFKFGHLSIEKGEFRLEDGKLSYVAIVNFFGKKARVGLQDFSLNEAEVKKVVTSVETGEIKEKSQQVEIYRLTVGVKFLDGAFALEIIPGKKIELKDVNLVFDQNKGIELKAIGSLLGQEVSLGGVFDPKNQMFSIEGALKKEKLSTMIPELKGSPISELSLEGTMSFSLKEDFNSFDEGLKIKGKLSGDKGAAIDLGDIKLTSADADIVISDKDRHVFISGKTNVLGLPMNAYFNLYFGKQKGIKFKAEVQPGVTEWKPFKDSPIIELSKITLHDLKAGVAAQYLSALAGEGVEQKDDKGNPKKETKKYTYTADDEQLFEHISEKDIGVIGEQGLQFSIYIEGQSTILNANSKVIVKIDTAKTGFGATAIAELVKGWKLSTSLPIFKPDTNLFCDKLEDCVKLCASHPIDCPPIFANYVKGMIELLEIEKARFAISTRKERVGDQLLEPGFNLLAKVSLDSMQKNPFMNAIKDVVQSTGKEKAALEMAGSFDPTSPRTAKFSMGVTTGGFGFKLGPAMLYGGGFNIVIRGEPSIGIEGLFKMKPGENEVPIEFAANAAFTPIKFDLSGSMKNIWKDPFGIKGFEFGNLAVRGSQTYTAIEEALTAAAGTAGVGALWLLVPSDLGFAGCMRFGPPEGQGRGFLGNTRINFGKDVTSMAIVVDVCDPLSLSLFLEVMFKQIGVDVRVLAELDKVVPIQLKKTGIKFVPIGTQIGNVVAKQGIGGYLYYDLFGKEAHVDFSLGLDGFTARGQVPAFEIGILKMTNYDNTCDTSIKAPAERQWGKICDCDNPNIRSPQPKAERTCGPQIDMQLNLQEQKFVIDGLMKIGDFIQSKTKWYLTKEGTGFDTETFVGPETAKFGIKLKGTSIAFNDLNKLFALEPKDISLEIEFKDDLSQKIRQDVSAELARTKAQFERDVNAVIEQAGRQTALDDIRRQDEAVIAAGNRRVSFWADPFLSAIREAEFRAEELKGTALRLKYQFEQSAVGQVVGDAVRALGIDKLAAGVLTTFRNIGVGVIEHGQLVFKDLSRLVVIKKIYWKGSLADLGTGKLNDVTIVVCAGCEQMERKISGFDLVNPINSVATIVQQTTDLVRDAVIATFKGNKCNDVCGA